MRSQNLSSEPIEEFDTSYFPVGDDSNAIARSEWVNGHLSELSPFRLRVHLTGELIQPPVNSVTESGTSLFLRCWVAVALKQAQMQALGGSLRIAPLILTSNGR
jgi:hypothetical protein